MAENDIIALPEKMDASARQTTERAALPPARPEADPAPEAPKKQRQREKKEKKVWPLFLGCWAAALLVLGLLGCFLLYQSLTVFEVTRPEARMDELMELMSAEDWLDKAAENLDFELSEFEDAQALFAGYRASLTTDQPLTYRSEKSGNDDEHAIFYVRSGPSNLCRVELVSGEQKLPFGRHNWKLGSISSGDITKYLKSATVEITALTGQTIGINGVELGSKYVKDKAVAIENLSDIESRMDTVPKLVRYRVSPLYGEIHVTADGRELAAEQQGKTLRYTAAADGKGSLTVIAPEDIRITVGGAELDRKDLTESSWALLEGLESYTGEAAFKTNVYRFTGLYSTPEVHAYAADGTELTPIMSGENVYHFFHPSDVAADEEDQKELDHIWELATGYFENYVAYTTKPFDGSIYYKLLNATLGGTELQKYIAQSNATMKWAARSTVENQELRVDNLHRIGDSCFTCTVEFTLDKTSETWVEDVSSSEANAEQMVFVRRGKYWYAAALSMIGE